MGLLSVMKLCQPKQGSCHLATYTDSTMSRAPLGLTQRSDSSRSATPTLDLRNPSPGFRTSRLSIARMCGAFGKQPLVFPAQDRHSTHRIRRKRRCPCSSSTGQPLNLHPHALLTKRTRRHRRSSSSPWRLLFNARCHLSKGLSEWRELYDPAHAIRFPGVLQSTSYHRPSPEDPLERSKRTNGRLPDNVISDVKRPSAGCRKSHSLGGLGRTKSGRFHNCHQTRPGANRHGDQTPT